MPSINVNAAKAIHSNLKTDPEEARCGYSPATASYSISNTSNRSLPTIFRSANHNTRLFEDSE